jgi:hypothetical protein
MNFLTKMDALHAKANPGPWYKDDYDDLRDASHRQIPVCGASMPCGCVPNDHPGHANADLLLHIANHWPRIRAVLTSADVVSTNGEYPDSEAMFVLIDALAALNDEAASDGGKE